MLMYCLNMQAGGNVIMKRTLKLRSNQQVTVSIDYPRFNNVRTVSISRETTCMVIDNSCISEIKNNSRSGKSRCESDQHSSMEFAGTRYSR